MVANNKIKKSKKKINKEVKDWKLSMKEILSGACLINGDGSLVQYRMKPKNRKK